jgi:urease accessory protein
VRAAVLRLGRAIVQRAAEARAPQPGRAGWQARLELDFAHRGERTVLGRRRHEGPLMVQSAFYPEGAPCHVYLLHPPGGLVGGDELDLRVHAGPASHALLTTPAAGKFYRSDGRICRVRQRLRVAGGATLEWLPGESIVFQGARCVLDSRIDLEPGARLLAWEAWGLGRPACGEGFDAGSFRQHQELWLDGRPLLVERNEAVAGSAWLGGAWGLGGHVAAATLLAYPGDARGLDAARRATGVDDGIRAAAGMLDGLLVCRVLARGLLALRTQIERWWRALRPLITGCAATPPRVWAT